MELQIGGVSAISLTKTYGTPLYVYDKQIILKKIQELKEAFPYARICYALKANSNIYLLKLIAQQGLGADCSNKIELELAEYAGFNLKESIFTAVNPSDEDLVKALQTGAMMNLDDLSIFYRLQKFGLPKKISFRINRGFGAGKFPGIVVGGKDVKFGMSEERAKQAYCAAKEAGIQEFGIHMMTGSCVLEESYFEELLKSIQSIAENFSQELNIHFEHINLGGGLGVPYEPEEVPLNLKRLGERIQKIYNTKSILMLEPGRYVVAESGMLLTTVNTIKNNFIGVDAGMTNLIRPALYGAYHSIVLANDLQAPKTESLMIVGPVCESTDCFAKDRPMPKIKEGNILAIQVAGAYSFAMSSQYNGRLRPSEVLLDNGLHKLIRKRETIIDLIQYEQL